VIGFRDPLLIIFSRTVVYEEPFVFLLFFFSFSFFLSFYFVFYFFLPFLF